MTFKHIHFYATFHIFFTNDLMLADFDLVLCEKFRYCVRNCQNQNLIILADFVWFSFFTAQLLMGYYYYYFIRFRWGIGTAPGGENIMAFRNFSHNTRHVCAKLSLQHNTKYYSTVIVFNGALNSKDSNSTSNGGKPYLLRHFEFRIKKKAYSTKLRIGWIY